MALHYGGGGRRGARKEFRKIHGAGEERREDGGLDEDRERERDEACIDLSSHPATASSVPFSNFRSA